MARFVPNPSLWRHAFQKRDDGKPSPTFVGRSFLPTASEQDKLSLFAFDDEEDPLFLAAAYYLINKTDHALVHVGMADLTAIGVSLTQCPGETDSDLVNERHYDAHVASCEKAYAVGELFYHGVLIAPEPRLLREQVANDNAAGTINLVTVARKKEQHRQVRLCELIAHEAVALRLP